MKDNWKAYLEHDAGAIFSNGIVTTFGNPERESRVSTVGNTMMDLSQFGLIGIRGEDACKFMQNLFCNDVREVTEQKSQLNAFCSAKGRIIANFLLFMRDDSYYLQLPSQQMDVILKKLQMYKLMSKVDIIDASNSFVRIGCSGPSIEQELSAISPQLPSEVGDVVQHNKLTIIRSPGRDPRFELIGDFDEIKSAWQRLDVQSAPVGSYQWQLHDILNGIPNIYPQTSEAFVPQTANLHLINSLSFTKGCYPGQEVVARSQYLGKLKRSMFLLHLDSDCSLEPGDELLSGDNGEVAGKVVDCQPSADQGFELLAVLRIDDVEKGRLTAKGDDKKALTVGKLPYQNADD